MSKSQDIFIKGARVHNLKNIDVHIPRNNLVVITGVSGSGKSSLAFDTLFAEGQRRYVESLSSYSRQFLARLDKPDVDYITGISPAIAIEQKVSSGNPRSTVGTLTEIYDYLRLLFGRIGITYSPISGEEVKSDSVSGVVDFIKGLAPETLVYITCKLQKYENWKAYLKLTLQQGFTRILLDNESKDIEELLEQAEPENAKERAFILIDRVKVRLEDEDFESRIADSIATAFFEGQGKCVLVIGTSQHIFSDRFERDGMPFERPTPQMFGFNNPYGACKTCEGFGRVIGIDEGLVIPESYKSVYEGAVAPWRSEAMGVYLKEFIYSKETKDFPFHKPYEELSEKELELLWRGNAKVKGIRGFFRDVEAQVHKIQYRVLLSRYRGYTACPDCKGSRVRKDALYVRIQDKNIADWLFMPVGDLAEEVKKLALKPYEEKIAGRILKEITNRLGYLVEVGLGYLTLNRPVATLSGGESQRINLATSLGSTLVGSLYILDEPSVGLHPRDGDRLISILEQLRDLGNTVIVVEHDEALMKRADCILDIGPLAGEHGGKVVAEGTLEEILKNENSLTAKYLSGKEKINVPEQRRAWNNCIRIEGAREHNLKNVTAEIPLNVFTVVTGVSGSGKSTLIRKILYPGLRQYLGENSDKPGKHMRLSGEINRLKGVEMVDQSPIGKSSRSNPVTYLKIYDLIRELFSETPLAKARNLKPGHFSFNVEGGRCETCQGDGTVTLEMQFLSDIELICESCNGKRFKELILEVKYKNKNISEVLDMTITEAILFFSEEKKIVTKLTIVEEVGLGYIRLGQSSSTFSGGEAQRIKLAAFLQKQGGDGNTLFIFDEPTTGLHFNDVKKLLYALNRLVEEGNTVLVIEHNLDVIKSADYVIDLGPEGGDKGGYLLFEGTPEELVKIEKSYTAKYLKEKLN